MSYRAILAASMVGLLGCTGGGSGGSGGTVVVVATPTPSPASTANPTDLTRLPIGDGKVVTSPQIGYVDSCQTSFGGGGATSTGAWYNAAAGTFDLTIKPAVQGSVAWPTHAFTATIAGATRQLVSNDLPSHTTGTYPIAASDPAHQYDGNPNSIRSQSVQFNVPANPAVAVSPSCLSLGPIGIMLTGSVFYNALDAGGRDAVAHEILDSCYGHPDASGSYHYHAFTPCFTDSGAGHSVLVGYARDGFGIFGIHDVDRSLMTDAKLDACHGHAHSITWDGVVQTLYHYHMTYEYPYTLGCYKGTPV
jgi:hypothetical protein